MSTRLRTLAQGPTAFGCGYPTFTLTSSRNTGRLVERAPGRQRTSAHRQVRSYLPSGPPWVSGRWPMIMHTFAESYDFTAKTIHPCTTTHAMSGLGTAERDYADPCRGATSGESLAVQGQKVSVAGPRPSPRG